jgi:hypothetical protein
MRPGNVSFEGRENSSVYTCYDPGEDLDWFQGPVSGHGYPRPVCCDGSYAAEYNDVVASKDEYLDADDDVQRGFPESEGAELEQRTCDGDPDLSNASYPEQAPSEIEMQNQLYARTRYVIRVVPPSMRCHCYNHCIHT